MIAGLGDSHTGILPHVDFVEHRFGAAIPEEETAKDRCQETERYRDDAGVLEREFIPTFAMMTTDMNIPHAMRSPALIICTQVVAFIPPKPT